MKPSATLQINQKAKAAIKNGIDVCHLGFGESPFPVHPLIRESLKNNTHQKSYLPSKGLLELRELIAIHQKENFGTNFRADNIILAPGSKQLLYQLLTVLEGEVIVPVPSWVSYGPILKTLNKELHKVKTDIKDSYKLKPESLEKKCLELGSSQKILIMNSPSNPTGAVYEENEIVELVQVARKYNLIIISDEIYALTLPEDKIYCGFSKIYPEGTIVTNGLSKSHHLGGYRIGYVAIPDNMDNLTKAMEIMTDVSYSSVSAPLQYTAITAFTKNLELENSIKICNKIHQAANSYLLNRFLKMDLVCPTPIGAYYLFPNFSAYTNKLKNKKIETSLELATRLFDEYFVAVLPGVDFYCDEKDLSVRVTSVDYDGELVLNSATKVNQKLDDQFIELNCPKLKTACNRIQKFLEQL